MTLEKALKRIDAQQEVINRLLGLLRRKNETIEQQRAMITEMQKEIATLRINYSAAQEGISPIIKELSKKGK